MTRFRFLRRRDSSFDTQDSVTTDDLAERGFDLVERVESVLIERPQGRHYRDEPEPVPAGPWPLLFTIHEGATP